MAFDGWVVANLVTIVMFFITVGYYKGKVDTTEIVAEKQRLRDLTDSANDKTPDELLLILKQLEGDK